MAPLPQVQASGEVSLTNFNFQFSGGIILNNTQYNSPFQEDMPKQMAILRKIDSVDLNKELVKV